MKVLPAVRIRHATPLDARPVHRFIFDIRSAYGVPVDLEGFDAELLEFGSPRDPGAIHLVGEIDGIPVGSVILTPRGRDTVKLSKLFVDSSRRGMGLGRSLLHRAVADARTHGYQQVFLTTRARYREAIRLYESEGWVRGPDQPGPGPERLYYLPLTGRDSAVGGTTVAQLTLQTSVSRWKQAARPATLDTMLEHGSTVPVGGRGTAEALIRHRVVQSSRRATTSCPSTPTAPS